MHKRITLIVDDETQEHIAAAAPKVALALDKPTVTIADVIREALRRLARSGAKS